MPADPATSSRVVVVTGASRGLGAGIARAAHGRGMSLVLCSRSAPVLPDGPRVLATKLDVRDAPAIDALAARAFERFGRVDLWINNAGLLEPVGPLSDVDPAALRELLEVNVLGVAHGSAAYARLLREHDQRGVLLNISSGAARKPYHGWAAYCASKAAVDRMSEVIALEEGERMRVHSVAPGVIQTGMQALLRGKDETAFRDVARFIALHEDGMLVDPEQAGHKLLELAFDPAARRDAVCIDLRDLN